MDDEHLAERPPINIAEALALACPDPVVVLDPAGRISFGNPAAEALLGRPRGGLADVEAAGFLADGAWTAPEPAAAVTVRLRLRVAGGGEADVDARVVRLDLPRGPFAAAFLRPAGPPRPAEPDPDLFREVVERLPAIVTIDAEDDASSTLYVSPGVETLLGYAPGEYAAAADRWQELVHPDDRAAVLAEAARTNATGEPFRMEYRYLARGGRTVWLHEDAVVLPAAEGEARRWLTVQVDVTERKEAEAALRRAKAAAEAAERAKAAFLRNLAHELRGPLTTVLGYAELLERGLGGEGRARQAADAGRVAAAARHLRGLVEDVVDLARIEAGVLLLAKEPVDLAALAREVAGALAVEAAAKGVALGVEAPEAGPVVAADPLRLRQVLLNLAGNAVKFTDRGEVAIAVRGADGSAEVAVRDTGVGIPAEALAVVFDEFRQADEGTTRRHGGLGLGLAIAKRLVELHGGTIRAESTEGVGSTFAVRLPLAAPAAGA